MHPTTMLASILLICASVCTGEDIPLPQLNDVRSTCGSIFVEECIGQVFSRFHDGIYYDDYLVDAYYSYNYYGDLLQPDFYMLDDVSFPLPNMQPYEIYYYMYDDYEYYIGYSDEPYPLPSIDDIEGWFYPFALEENRNAWRFFTITPKKSVIEQRSKLQGIPLSFGKRGDECLWEHFDQLSDQCKLSLMQLTDAWSAFQDKSNGCKDNFAMVWNWI